MLGVVFYSVNFRRSKKNSFQQNFLYLIEDIDFLSLNLKKYILPGYLEYSGLCPDIRAVLLILCKNSRIAMNLSRVRRSSNLFLIASATKNWSSKRFELCFKRVSFQLRLSCL